MALPSFSSILGDRGQLDRSDDEDEGGLVCEMRTFEERFDSKGERIRLEVGTRHFDVDDEGDREMAFVLTRKYDKYRELEQTTLAIRSPHAKKALQKVIVRYPGIDFHAAVVVITGDPRCLFHYRKELKSYLDALRDEEAIKHVEMLLKHTRTVFSTDLATWHNLMESTIIAATLPFLGLWMAFKPGSKVYMRTDGIDRVLRLKKISRCECLNPFCWRSRWFLVLEEITFDGDKFGYNEVHHYISPYTGAVKLSNLKIFPLEYHLQKTGISRALTARGAKYVNLHGTHHKYYEGPAISPSEWRENECSIRSRVMIDVKAFVAMDGATIDHQSELDLDKQGDGSDAHTKLTEDDFIICDYTIPGFCFTTKRWYILKVDMIQDIEFNSEAFKSLLLPEHQKQMIHSLVKVHTSNGTGFDDLIKGKGKGMVFLLHGVPGTGKTLTAEGIADYTKRPLYTVSCGELGIDSSNVEKNLKTALDLATTWNAIILIDEADIFLEARGPNDLKRNGLVSIFLRLLEYYQGILFLTTNRVSVFDPAIKSRIHLAIKYHALPLQSRRDLWNVFINRACSKDSVEWLDEDCLDRLGRENLNGRQIKNAVRTAQALALSDECELKASHIYQSLTAMSMFEVNFAEETQENRENAEESLEIGNPSKRKRTS